MSWDINKVVLVGRLACEVDLKTTPSGDHVANFRIAVGAGEDKVSFFSIVAWKKVAEVCEKYLIKGKQIAVDGRLEQRSWTANDGSKRSIVEVIAERVEFIGGGNTKKDTTDKQEKGESWEDFSQETEHDPANAAYSDKPLDSPDIPY